MRRRDDTVTLRISDTGIGIAPEKLEAVFEPFVQLKEGLADRASGIGLGLAISRDLARAMKGDLTVESSEGHGARFTLVLPRGGVRIAIDRAQGITTGAPRVESGEWSSRERPLPHPPLTALCAPVLMPLCLARWSVAAAEDPSVATRATRGTRSPPEESESRSAR